MVSPENNLWNQKHLLALFLELERVGKERGNFPELLLLNQPDLLQQ